MDLAGQRYAHLKFDLKLKRPTYRTGGTKKSDSKTDFRFVFSDPENLGYTTVSKIDSNFRYYGHLGFKTGSRFRDIVS